MTKLHSALLAGVVASGLLSTIFATPAAAEEQTHHKTAAHARAAHAAAHTHAATHVRTMAREHAVTRARAATVRSAAPVRFARATIPRETAVRFERQSHDRLQVIARSRPAASHVTLRRVALRAFTIRHVTLRNVTFLTGTVVRREPGLIVLRSSTGVEVPVVTRVAVIDETEFVPGTTVVIPTQFTNGSVTFFPAFTPAEEEEEEVAAMPVAAPCALNDGDADDVGVVGAFAPVGACLTNDGDSDDGFAPPPLPVGFAPAVVPTVFSTGYVPVVASGFVVTQAGSNVMLMTPNFTPLVVNASPAMSSGALSGPLTVGRYVTVYGYDVGNSLVATSIM